MHPVVRAPVNAEAVAVLHRAARPLMDDLPRLTDRVVELLRKEEPAYRAASVDQDELWHEVYRSLRHNVGSLLRPKELRDAARRCSWRIGAERAEQGLPLDALMRAFRIGGAVVWQSLVDRVTRYDPDGARLLVHVAAEVWDFVDEHCAVVAEAYRRTERRLAWRHDNRQRLMADALLEGTMRVADLAETSEALGLPERGRYAVVIVAGPGREAHRALIRSRVPAAVRILWHPRSDADLGIAPLGGGPGDSGEPGDPGTADAAEAADGLLAELAGALPALPGLRTGISSAVEGLAQVGDARRLAETALRSATPGGAPVLLHEHLPAALLVSSPGLAAALAERVLGPVLRLEGPDRDLLLDTLAVWLECDGSARRAGSRLFCHRNTVLNRLRRFEQLTGRSLGRPHEVAELSLALTARRVLHGRTYGEGPGAARTAPVQARPAV
ncbi:PucR family transcriptional regulator [Streptomyces radiopugnans]|uniref:PucR C-terminal helix-turn-helix domain-containing protein n=1 Tax=Streptomyces radiopugnans TaxID=403935 RepID=A0A1H8Z8I3_9ACTN|nr:helix-turn-helix domain-containing protein [Streptomyces radiopugnans]SEP60651.1 PucR C-terminal helix-turn-helix domain-containing protein [Streptomyces radiopugnans]